MNPASSRPDRAVSASGSSTVDLPGPPRPLLLQRSLLLFLGASLVLFCSTSMHPFPYDEGLILTAAMRVAAGQVPHRDFYANYGPAQFYLLAGLFRLFGESIFVERLYSALMASAVVVAVYRILSAWCRQATALWTAVLVGIWMFGMATGSPLIPALLFNLLGVALLFPAFTSPAPRRWVLAAGAASGMEFLFRYDTGVALIGVQAIVLALAVLLDGRATRLRRFATLFWPCLLGFTIVIGIPVLLYLAVAPIHAWIHDIVLYPAKYYRAARGLPFPGITLKTNDNVEIYLPIVIVCLSLYAASLRYWNERPALRAFLLAFALLASVMFGKGLVRISVIQVFLAVVPSLLLLAVLFEHRQRLPSPARILLFATIFFSATSAAWSSLRWVKNLHAQHTSVPGHAFAVLRRSAPAFDTAWCHSGLALTSGLCFSPGNDRIRAIEYIVSHTRSDERIFVGLARHDIISVNDNLTYFATQRLPATRWSHFDPDLQNRRDIQTQMIQEFEVTPPALILEDAEVQAFEPNDSSKSSGVTLLDDYIHRNYRRVQVFGLLSIWQPASLQSPKRTSAE